jgi:hypothetical protein
MSPFVHFSAMVRPAVAGNTALGADQRHRVAAVPGIVSSVASECATALPAPTIGMGDPAA